MECYNFDRRKVQSQLEMKSLAFPLSTFSFLRNCRWKITTKRQDASIQAIIINIVLALKKKKLVTNGNEMCVTQEQ